MSHDASALPMETARLGDAIIRLGAGDPGKQRSRFGIVIADVLQNEIRVRGAKEYGRFDYTVVEDDIDVLCRQLKLRRFSVELNNTGQHVVDSIKRYHPAVPLFTVNTVGKAVTDPDKIAEDRSMYKEGTAEWVARLKQTGVLKFPKETTPALEELKRQMENFLPHVTPTGHISYHTDGTMRDDLVMALLILCYTSQAFLDRNYQPTVLGGASDTDYWEKWKSSPQQIFEQNNLGARLRAMRDGSPGLEITEVRVNGETVELDGDENPGY